MRTLFMLLCLMLPALPLCAAPDWLDGVSERYPAGDYLIGVGVSDALDGARTSARAEIAKVFTARITQRAQDIQHERITRDRQKTRVQSGHSIVHSTTILTDELLKGVAIAETWLDTKQNQYYALAVLDRRATRQSLARQLLEQEELLAAGRERIDAGGGIMTQLRAVSATLKALDAKELLKARLQVVDPTAAADSGDARLRADLEDQRVALAARVRCVIEADEIPGLYARIAEKITAFGFSVSPAAVSGEASGTMALSLRAAVTVTPVQRNNPRWKFCNWESMVSLMDPATGNAAVAAVVKNGQSAQVTEEAARIKAAADAVRGAADAAEQVVHTYIYGQ